MKNFSNYWNINFIGLMVLIVKVFPFMKFMNQFEVVEVDQKLR